MKKAYSFEDLEVWVAARRLSKEVFDLTQKTAINKDYSLRDQLRRASSSPMSNIAEGFMRGGNKEFIQFLFIARGSAGETKNHLYLALDRKYINQEQFDIIERIIKELLNKLDAFIKYLKSSKKKGIKHS